MFGAVASPDQETSTRGLTGKLDVGVATCAVSGVDDGGGFEESNPVRYCKIGGVPCREERGGVEVVRREDRETALMVLVDPFLKPVGCGMQVSESCEGLAMEVSGHHRVDVVSLEGLEELALAGEVEG